MRPYIKPISFSKLLVRTLEPFASPFGQLVHSALLLNRRSTITTRVMAAIQPTVSIDQHLSARLTQSQHEKITTQVSYTYDANSNRDDLFQRHRMDPMTCLSSMDDYSLQQTRIDDKTGPSQQISANLGSGAASSQPSWCKFHQNYSNTGSSEYAQVAASYDSDPLNNNQSSGSLQQTQADCYYSSDPNRGFYMNPTTTMGATTVPTVPGPANMPQTYHTYNRATSWPSQSGDDSAVYNNYGYYEAQNQQENIQDKLIYYHQQANPSNQYPSESQDASRFTSAYNTGNHEHYFANNHHHHHHQVQAKPSANPDPNRSYYYDRSFERAGVKSSQDSHPWAQAQPNAESCGVVQRPPSSSICNSQTMNQENGRLPEVDRSWPPEPNQSMGENQGHQRTEQQQSQKFKFSSMSKSCNNKQSQSSNGSVPRTNQCEVCGRNYARPSTLKTHLRTHTNERPFKCNVCLKSFSQAANLTAHQRVHTGERPFSCPICGRQFSQSSSVITHLRTHSGERPYRCSMCSRTFSDSSTLTKHCRIHSGEKPYQCDYCPLNFSQSGNLSRHLKLHPMGATSSNSSSSSSATSSSQSSSSYNGLSEAQDTSTKDSSDAARIECVAPKKLY